MAITVLNSNFSLDQTYQILNHAQGLYPVIILGVFIICFITFGVINSPNDGDKITVQSMRGPGGRPLPTRRKSNNQIKEAVAVRDFTTRAKIAFAVLTSFVILTFVANGVSALLQIIAFKDDHWWPGQSYVVSCQLFNAFQHEDLTFSRFSWLLLSSLGE